MNALALGDVAGFRAGLRAWLDSRDLSPGPDTSLDGQVAQLARVRRELYDAGWMRYGWPASVGGLGGAAVLRAVLGEEVAGRDLAEPGICSMVEVLAPTVISYAAPALASSMVPLLLSGREQWCQGFSEPGAGSDLASLTTRAVPRGDSWVVTGQKVWTSLAQYAARCVLLTRTAPGHGGITAFFADMSSPGSTVRPLASFQAVRHRLAETLVALEGAEAALAAASDDLGSLLAKAAAGQAALTAARHCQQVLGGIGFSAEHGLHRHVRRALVLDGLLGSARELTREAGALLIAERSAPRVVNLLWLSQLTSRRGRRGRSSGRRGPSSTAADREPGADPVPRSFQAVDLCGRRFGDGDDRDPCDRGVRRTAGALVSGC